MLRTPIAACVAACLLAGCGGQRADLPSDDGRQARSPDQNQPREKDEPSDSLPDKNQSDPAADAARKTLFISESHNFAARFPGEAEPTMVEGLDESWTYAVEDREAIYAIAVKAVPESLLAEGVEAVLDDADEGYIEEAVTERRRITLGEYDDPYPGVEIRMESNAEQTGAARVARAKIYLIGSETYTIAISGPPSRREALEDDEFFESFALSMTPAKVFTPPRPPKAASQDIKPLFRIEQAIARGVTAIAVHPDGDKLLAMGTGNEGNVRLLEVPSGKQLHAFDHSSGSVLPVAISPDGKLLAIGTYGHVVLRESQTGKELRRLKSKKGSALFASLIFTPDSKRLLASTEDVILAWDANSGDELLRVKAGDVSFEAVALMPDASRIAAGRHDATISIHDLESGKVQTVLSGGHDQERVTTLAVSPDGKTLASFAIFEQIVIWGLEDGSVIHKIAAPDLRVDALQFLNDNRTLAFPDRDANIRLVDAATGALRAVCKGHAPSVDDVPAQIGALAISRDGKTLFSGSEDKSVIAWDVSSLD